MMLIDFLLNIDKYIGILIENFGLWAYLILFAIIFCETGLVFTPLLPGDSLLFVAGTSAALGSFNIFLLFLLLSIAAILGDSINYFAGNYFGKKFLSGNRFVRKEYLDRTSEFYEKYGSKTIIIARFVPIIRTFAPFLAGVGKMNYSKFFAFNVIGGLLWVSVFVFSGFFFSQIPFVEENLDKIILAIIFVSLIPIIFEIFKNRKSKVS